MFWDLKFIVQMLKYLSKINEATDFQQNSLPGLAWKVQNCRSSAKFGMPPIPHTALDKSKKRQIFFSGFFIH